MVNKNKKELSPEQPALPAGRRNELLKTLKNRFEKKMNRHKGLEWAKVQSRLSGIEVNKDKLWSLNEMERTGGEPDVVGYDKKTSEYIFYDCSVESPIGRRSVCYDQEGLESRKEHKPENNAIDMAAAMGIELSLPSRVSNHKPSKAKSRPAVFLKYKELIGRTRRF